MIAVKWKRSASEVDAKLGMKIRQDTDACTPSPDVICTAVVPPFSTFSSMS